MRISDWSSDVCSSDLRKSVIANPPNPGPRSHRAKSRCPEGQRHSDGCLDDARYERKERSRQDLRPPSQRPPGILRDPAIRLAVDPRPAASLGEVADRSEEHTSELPSLMRRSYAVFGLKHKTPQHTNTQTNTLQ